MWFSLFGAVLVLAVTFFQGLQGLFSSVIMCVLTILCAGLAFGTYENVYYGFLFERMPNHGEAVALVAIFSISLLLLRTAADNVLKGNMVLPVLVDRIGGGALGLVSALIIVGMIQIGFQMLPFDESFLGFNRFSPVSATTQKDITEEELKNTAPSAIAWPRSNLLFNPDGFTVKIVSLLSDGALRGANRFSDVYPDFTGQMQNARNGTQRESNRVAMISTGIEASDPVYYLVPPGKMIRPIVPPPGTSREDAKASNSPSDPPPGGYEWRAYRMALRRAALDSDGQVRFRGPQVRIVGEYRGTIVEYGLKAVQRESDPDTYVQLFRSKVMGRDEFCDVNRAPAGDASPYEFVFEVPTDFKAHFIEFKRTARADASKVARDTDEKTDAGKKGGKPSTKKPQGNKKPDNKTTDSGNTGGGDTQKPKTPDRVSGISVDEKKTHFGDKLPIALTAYDATAEVKNKKLMGGKFAVRVADQKGDGPNAITSFDVPDGHQLLFVPVEEMDPKSTLGQAMGFAVRETPSVRLIHSKGEERPVGRYAVADVNGEFWLEIQYQNEQERDANAALPDFTKLSHRILTQSGTDYVYLFLVPSGAQANALRRGRGEQIDLKSYNLIAK